MRSASTRGLISRRTHHPAVVPEPGRAAVLLSALCFVAAGIATAGAIAAACCVERPSLHSGSSPSAATVVAYSRFDAAADDEAIDDDGNTSPVADGVFTWSSTSIANGHVVTAAASHPGVHDGRGAPDAPRAPPSPFRIV